MSLLVNISHTKLASLEFLSAAKHPLGFKPATVRFQGNTLTHWLNVLKFAIYVKKFFYTEIHVFIKLNL